MIISTILTLIAAFTLYVGGDEGNWMPGVLMSVLALLSWLGYIVVLDDAKAYVNRTSYWARSGKDRARLRHRWEEEARREEAAERTRAARKREARKSRRVPDEQKPGNGLLMRCPKCEMVMNVTGTKRYADGDEYLCYECVRCGEVILKKKDTTPQEKAELERQREETRWRREAYVQKQRELRNGGGGYPRAAAPKRVVVCHMCGRYVDGVTQRHLEDGRVAWEYHCPRCGNSGSTFI